MVQLSVSLEGSHGLTWPLWRQFVSKVEELGFAGLYLTDHFPHGQAALELIVGLSYLAQQTQRIHFSPMVAPLSFRDPRILARQAAALDDLSGGRMILGMGTGWVEQEHQRWGYELGDKRTRVDRFAEGLHVITSLLRSDEPVTFAGRFYQLQGAQLLPRPQRPGGPRILVGGNGRRRILPLVAQYADIWNANNLSVAAFQERSALLDELLRQGGRQPGDVKRTLFLPVLCGRTDDEIKQRLGWLYRGMPHLAALPLQEQLRQMEEIFTPIFERAGASYVCIIATPEEAIARLRPYVEAGVEEIIIQWSDTNDIEGLRLITQEVMPHLQG
jgi:alkanesulfonate monooxygenase SsuD/methylene tetrahydromethanopterin reductase-like flavin-dependent oxidoreductase (luciferase family)